MPSESQDCALTDDSTDTLQNIGNGFVDRGIVMGEGDGTVNLMSSGYMCSRGWKIKRYNPANISVIAYEMPHEPDRFDPRGGPNTGDHVDILGRRELNDLILRVAGGKGHLIQDKIVSNIREYSAKVRIYDDDDGEQQASQPEVTDSQGLLAAVSSGLEASVASAASKVERLLDEL